MLLHYLAKRGNTKIAFFTQSYTNALPEFNQLLLSNWQLCAQRKAQVYKLLKGDFEVFRPTGATHCTDGGEIWHGGAKLGSTTTH